MTNIYGSIFVYLLLVPVSHMIYALRRVLLFQVVGKWPVTFDISVYLVLVETSRIGTNSSKIPPSMRKIKPWTALSKHTHTLVHTK